MVDNSAVNDLQKIAHDIFGESQLNVFAVDSNTLKLPNYIAQLVEIFSFTLQEQTINYIVVRDDNVEWATLLGALTVLQQKLIEPLMVHKRLNADEVNALIKLNIGFVHSANSFFLPQFNLKIQGLKSGKTNGLFGSQQNFSLMAKKLFITLSYLGLAVKAQTVINENSYITAQDNGFAFQNKQAFLSSYQAVLGFGTRNSFAKAMREIIDAGLIIERGTTRQKTYIVEELDEFIRAGMQLVTSSVKHRYILPLHVLDDLAQNSKLLMSNTSALAHYSQLSDTAVPVYALSMPDYKLNMKKIEAEKMPLIINSAQTAILEIWNIDVVNFLNLFKKVELKNANQISYDSVDPLNLYSDLNGNTDERIEGELATLMGELFRGYHQ
ncbi:MAG: hypothetical protein LBT80_08770 [Lactobacillaceae bacterium]|nr:hypothetical protein [Lactobacillaceae bacterium]